MSKTLPVTEPLSRLKKPALWLVVLVFALTVVFYLLGIEASLEPPYLALALYIIFLILPSFFMVAITISGFLRTGSWPVLWLGIGTITFALGTLFGSWLVAVSTANIAVTASNIIFLTAGAFHLIGGFFAINQIAPQENTEGRTGTVLQVYLPVLIFIMFVTIVSTRGLLPPFFVPSTGGTPLRQMVVGTAAIFFLLSGLLIFSRYRKARASLLYWYSLGLLLISLGMLGVLMPTSLGTPLNWMGRIAQFLGGLSLFIAALVTLKEARARQITAGEALAGFFPSSANYRLLVDMANDAINATALAPGNSFVIQSWNRAAERIYGWRAEEVIGKNANGVLQTRYTSPGMSREKFVEQLLGWGFWTGEVVQKRKDGSEVTVRRSVGLLRDERGNPTGAVAISSDITERKKMEEALRRANDELVTNVERLKRSQEIAHLGSWELDLINDRLSWSDEVYRIFGLKPQEFGATLEAFLDAVHPDDRAAVDKAYSSSIREGRDSYDIVHRIVRKSTEEIRYVHERCQHARDESGKIIRSIGMVHDITERKQAEEQIKQIAEEWQSTFDSINDLVSIQDRDFRLVRVNQAYQDAVKVSQEELVGKHCYEVIHGTACPVPDCPYEQTLKTGRSSVREMFEPRLGIYLEASTSPIFDKNGEVVGSVHIVKDITERHQSQEKLLTYERLATLGKVAGNIAHELRNPLAVVDSSVFYLARLLPRLGTQDAPPDAPQKIADHLERMHLGIRRSEGIIRTLLDLTHMREPEFRRVNLRAVAREALREHSLPAAVSLNLDFPGSEVWVGVDLTQMNMVLANVITNALQSMEGGGTLTVSVASRESLAELAVTDTGVGIPPENLPKIFEPLFTTKAKGIGLGLAISRMIVEKHHGTIEARSQVGKGTTMLIRLPLAV